jgi:hypothetical protein
VRVRHFGRSIPAEVRTALEERDRCCAVPGCSQSVWLEFDHRHDFALGGPTSYDNIDRLCTFHHRQKTHHGYRLHGPPEARRWVRGELPMRRREGSDDAPTASLRRQAC